MSEKITTPNENGGTSLVSSKQLGLKANLKNVKYIFKFKEQVSSK